MRFLIGFILGVALTWLGFCFIAWDLTPDLGGMGFHARAFILLFHTLLGVAGGLIISAVD